MRAFLNVHFASGSHSASDVPALHGAGCLLRHGRRRTLFLRHGRGLSACVDLGTSKGCTQRLHQGLQRNCCSSERGRTTKRTLKRGLRLAAAAEVSCEPRGTAGSVHSHNAWWSKAARIAVGSGVLLAAGLMVGLRPASAATRRQEGSQPPAIALSIETTSSSWALPISDAERLAAAAERSQAAASSSGKSRGWHDTGIELAKAKARTPEGGDVNMKMDQYQKYLQKEFGEHPKYAPLFMPQKKAKMTDIMKSQVADPASWDTPEFQPMTAWRVDRMKDMTYTQLWLLIKERKVATVKFSNDQRTVMVTTKRSAPGGRRTEKVALPYDPDLYHHMIEHGVIVETPKANMQLDNVLFGCLYLVYPVLIAIVLFMGTVNISFDRKKDEEELFKSAQLERLHEANNKMSFADIAGIEDVKEEVDELVQFLRNPKRFTNLGAKAPSGVLLVGNPGTGKTLLAKAVAGEAGVPFLSVAGSEFDQLFVGVGAARVRDMFRQARESAPCILFIDEFDGIGKQRSLSSADESANTINSLLTELDGFEDNTGVIVLAATNRPAALDNALTRPGRFDRIIQLPLPSIDGRIAILKVHARGKKMAPDADFSKVARATGGFTGAMLMNIMNTAAIVAVRRSSNVITTEDMFTALEDIQQESFSSGAKYEDDQASPLTRRGIALYEGARALIGSIIPYYDEIQKVVCCPGGETMGYTHFIPQEEQLESRVMTRAYMEAKMTVALAGRMAEKMVFGEAHISMTGASDLELANFIAREMVYQCGFSRRLGPVTLMDSHTGFLSGISANYISDVGTELTAIALADIQELLHGAEAKASFGLAVNYASLRALVEALIERESLSGEEVAQVLESSGIVRFPDPFVQGFGWDGSGALIYPGMDEEKDSKPSAEKKEGDAVQNGKSRFRIRKDLPPYPYRVRDDLQDLIGDELKVLDRLS